MGSGKDKDGAEQDWSQMTQNNLQAMESYVTAFTDALSKTTGAWAEVTKSAERDPSQYGPDPDPLHVASDTAKVLTHLAADPGAMMKAQTALWSGMMQIWANAAQRMATGEPASSSPTPSADKRWRHKDWNEQPVFDVIKQSYLHISDWMVSLVESVGGVDDATKRKVAFFTKQLADAFSPTNFPFTNPDVLQAAAQERGENFVRGMRNLAGDLARGHGKLAISQTDFSQFKVGENVATTPGDVVFENRLLQVIQYRPQTATAHAIPLLIFPPWINKFYILDLREENSMVNWLTQQGFQVFLVSWVNPTADYADVRFDDYMLEGILPAVDAVCQQADVPAVNTVGYCIGGTLLSATLAYMAKKNDTRIQSATFFAAQTDFAEAGDLLMFITDDWLSEIERRMDQNGGVLDGQSMADTFNMLRANDLVWSFMINNYLLGKDPRPFDLLYWNSDQTRMPKGVHLHYLDQFYRKNALAKGEFTMNGEPVALGDVSIPTFFQASREDHIAPYNSVYRGVRLFGGERRFMLAGSGHIAGVINHPSANKYQHCNNPTTDLPPTVEAWLAEASEAAGSWWPDWSVWLAERSGPKVKPTPAAEAPLKPIEPAPGRYVTAP